MKLKFEDWYKYHYKVCSCCNKPIRPQVDEKIYRDADLVADFMGGSGTILVGAAIGRNILYCELEQKFVDMAKANWEKIKSLGPMLGYTMGEAVILQGDSRNLDGLLATHCIFSPPHGDSYSIREGGQVNKEYVEKRKKALRKQGKHKLADSLKVEEYASRNPSNIGNLPYGSISTIVSSPPFCESANKKQQKMVKRSYFKRKNGKPAGGFLRKMEVPENPNNISGLPYGQIDQIISSPPYEAMAKSRTGGICARDKKIKQLEYVSKDDKPSAIITSPPYEAIATGGTEQDAQKRKARLEKAGYDTKKLLTPGRYEHGNLGIVSNYNRENKDNIGNLKSANYLEAMLTVYRQCFGVLRDGGLMILVVKNFIRKGQIIRLDLDTIRLCEQAGFVLKERLARKLTQQSFWRNIALMKCDHRKAKRKCDLGLSCPLKPKAQQILAFIAQESKDSFATVEQVMEKICPKYVNTMPNIKQEDVLVFEKR